MLDLHTRIGRVVGSLARLDGNRAFVAVDALMLGLELHGGIGLLLRYHHWASSNALMRPLLETTIRAMWILYEATDAQIDRVMNGKDKTTLTAMLNALSISKESRLRDLAATLGKDQRSVIHSFTHMGNEQLSRREIGFLPLEIYSQTLVADMFALICVDGISQIYPNEVIREHFDADYRVLLMRFDPLKSAAATSPHPGIGLPQPSSLE